MKKRLLFVIMLVIMMLPNGIVASTNTEADQITQFIHKVKEKITIPKAYCNFDYAIDRNRYHLVWQTLDGNGYIEVVLNDKGVIQAYNKRNEESSSQIAKITYEEAIKKANQFMQQIVPQYTKELFLEKSNVPSKSSVYRLQYKRKKEGIDVFLEKVTVCISKETGEVVSFSGINYDPSSSYETPKEVMSVQEANKFYLEQIGLDLIYNIKYQYKENKVQRSSELIYAKEHGSYEGIHALTGKKVEYTLERGFGSNKEESATEEISKEDTKLTEEEQKAINENRTFLSGEQLKDKYSQYFKQLDKMEVQREHLYCRMGTYIREVFYISKEGRKAMLRADAKTGELENYEYYDEERPTLIKGDSEHTDKDKKALEGISKAEMEEQIKKIQGNTDDKFILDKVRGQVENDNYQHFYYNRVENDIIVPNDMIYIQYDKKKKEIVYYDKQWSEVEFKKPEHIISLKDSINKIGLKLYYMKNKDNQYELVYNVEDSYIQIDAFTGEKIKEYYERNQQDIPFYEDVKGHVDEEMIKALFNSGIYLDTRKLKPDTTITEREFLTLLVRMRTWNTVDEDEVLERCYSLGLLEENKPLTNKSLTKGEALIYLMKLTPYEHIVGLETIYKYPYKDKDINHKYIGSIALGYGLDITEKGEYFKPEEPLSKVQAMTYIYNLMKLDIKN